MDETICDAGLEARRGRGHSQGSCLVAYSHLPADKVYESDRYHVHPIECVGDFDYADGLNGVWNKGATLVIVEHDIGVSDSLIQGLLECPHPCCTYAYQLYWASTFSEDVHYAQRHGMNGAWVAAGAPICDFTGIGFCKVEPAGVKDAHPLERRHWSEVDMAVTNAVNGPWHIHWLVDVEGNHVGVDHYHQ